MTTIRLIALALFLPLVPLLPAGHASVLGKESGQFVWVEPDKGGANKVYLYMFWSHNCKHCHYAMPFLDDIKSRYPWIQVRLSEVTEDPRNMETYLAMAEQVGEQAFAGAVPAFFFCGQMYTGYNDAKTTGKWILDSLQQCRINPPESDVRIVGMR
ncbi:MAG: hypothetical protein ACFCUG_13355 [Thiotrichales bacterium]